MLLADALQQICRQSSSINIQCLICATSQVLMDTVNYHYNYGLMLDLTRRGSELALAYLVGNHKGH